MNTEALFLFLILLLGLALCSFLGGNCNKESFTGNFNGNFTVNPDDKTNNNIALSGSSGSSSSSDNSTSSKIASTNYDNYNHYSGSSSQLTNGATFYGKNGDSVKVNMQSDGTPALTITFTQGKQPVILTSSAVNSSGSISKQGQTLPTPTSTSDVTSSSQKNNTGSLDKSSNIHFYGPNGETALLVNHEGEQAIKVNPL